MIMLLHVFIAPQYPCPVPKFFGSHKRLHYKIAYTRHHKLPLPHFLCYNSINDTPLTQADNLIKALEAPKKPWRIAGVCEKRIHEDSEPR